MKDPLRVVVIGGSDAGISAAMRARELRPEAEVTLFTADAYPNFSRGGRLLGAQIVGHRDAQVAKRIDIFAAALHHGMRVADIADLDLSYTPPLSSPWDPVQMAAMQWRAGERADA